MAIRRIERIKVGVRGYTDEKERYDEFKNDVDGVLDYTIPDEQYNNLYIYKDGYCVAYYPRGCWVRLYIDYAS